MSVTTDEDVGGVATGEAPLVYGNNDKEETTGAKKRCRAAQQNKESKRAAGIGCSDVGSTFALDHTSQFTTTEIFKSRQYLIEWASRVGRSNGFSIVTLSSDVGKSNRRATITLGCERSGKYDRRTPKEGKKKNCGKKCGCPFKLKGRKLETNDDWELKVVEGIHNHAAWYSKADISVSSRLPSEDKSRGKDVFKDDISESGSEMQSLMIKLSKYNYIEQHRSCPQTKTILDFFLTHLSSFKLLRAFARVLEVECISKQEGIHDGAILMIFGRTSTDIPFFVGIVFLSSNKKESYVWALRTLQGLMVTSGNTMPDMIVLITTEVALMEAVEVVFSRTKLLLCAWAFPSFVGFAYEEVFDSKEELDYFLKRLDVLISSPTAANFELQLLQLHDDFSRYPAVLEYVTHTWLNPHKEKLVAAWTNAFMHFGVANSFREDTKLQEILGNLIENLTVPVKNQILKLEESFEEIHAGLELQETKINASLESCLTVNADEFRLPEFKELCGAISLTALDLVLQQMMLVNIVDGDLCHCAIRNTHGLPCAHELAKYKKGDRLIPLDCIDPYWMKLDTKPLGKNAVWCGREYEAA
ncbi:uncharacterized protein LOC133744138 [Rosa rugosa]|uniref:uncharacterized protein LOC133744138 n=1 Tax=Rosa rugosa TaxID=74645 RepID=UPI002B406E33|nr:uncharacterized protein LOC133744138 [Rosa rugosa]